MNVPERPAVSPVRPSGLRPAPTPVRLADDARPKRSTVASLDVHQAYAHYLSTHFGGDIREGDESFALQERYFRKNYLPHLPQRRDARIVDLGCGLGHFLFFLQRAGYANILGVDVGRQCIEFCQSRGFPVVEEEIASHLDQHPERADAFILNDVLEHQTKDQMWVLLELMRERLVPGGVALIKVPNVAHPLLGASSRYLDITHELGFTENSLEQVLLMAGFADVRVFGPDIYVTTNPLVNVTARATAGLLDRLFSFLFKFYGRTETTIFRKNIVAVAYTPTPRPAQPAP